MMHVICQFYLLAFGQIFCDSMRHLTGVFFLFFISKLGLVAIRLIRENNCCQVYY